MFVGIIFTELMLGSFGNELVNKIRHCVLDILMCWKLDHCETNHQIKADTIC